MASVDGNDSNRTVSASANGQRANQRTREGFEHELG